MDMCAIIRHAPAVGDFVTQHCAKQGVATIGRLPAEAMRRLSRASGVEPIGALSGVTPHARLAICERYEELSFDGDAKEVYEVISGIQQVINMSIYGNNRYG
jgi:hypothetical protein